MESCLEACGLIAMVTSSGAAESEKTLWANWDIHVLMLTSLLIQVLLTFLAPLRKRVGSGLFGFSMWMVYLSADAIALYTIGLISHGYGQGDSPEKTILLAFWAPFLLLHLGGPDTITALALEDNELWHRHALQFVTQVGVTVYVFIHSLQHDNHLWLPTILMFFNGCIKYAERISALYYASADAFRESVLIKPESGPSYTWIVEEYYAAQHAHIPVSMQHKTDIVENTNKLQSEVLDLAFSDDDDSNIEIRADSEIYLGEPLDREQVYITMVSEAYYYYVKFKGLLADAFINFQDRKESCDYFLNKCDIEAFRIVQIELNIIYDVFYTKAFFLKKKRAIFRVLALLSCLISVLLFCLKNRKYYKGGDLIVSFALLGGAVALDVCAFIVLFISDWGIIIVSRDSNIIPAFLRFLLERLMKCLKWLRNPPESRWSQSVSQYNLLLRCLKEPPSFLNVIFVKRIRDGVMGWLYGNCKDVDEQLVKFIVDELRMKAKLVSHDFSAVKDVCSSRGNLVLQTDYSLISEILSPWTMDIDYDESLLTWHFATDICHLSSENVGPANNLRDYRNFSKTLSEYMSYLLLTKQVMVSTLVGKSEMLFDDTRAEVKMLLKTKMVEFLSEGISEKPMKFFYNKLRQASSQKDQRFLEQFSKRVLESYVRPMMDKGNSSKYILFNARNLAEQLNKIGEKQWEIMSKVWLELLCYAAIRCSPRSHVAQLSKGGELITLVWLLMTHLGLGKCFLHNQGFRWTKLIIHK